MNPTGGKYGTGAGGTHPQTLALHVYPLLIGQSFAVTVQNPLLQNPQTESLPVVLRGLQSALVTQLYWPIVEFATQKNIAVWFAK
jgi:hypothetical protein